MYIHVIALVGTCIMYNVYTCTCTQSTCRLHVHVTLTCIYRTCTCIMYKMYSQVTCVHKDPIFTCTCDFRRRCSSVKCKASFSLCCTTTKKMYIHEYNIIMHTLYICITCTIMISFSYSMTHNLALYIIVIVN